MKMADWHDFVSPALIKVAQTDQKAVIIQN
jgi:hypothetical protein